MNAPNNNLRQMIWDLGPSAPEIPERPVLPEGLKPDSPAALMADSDFKAAMSVYENDRDSYAKLKREYDKWHRENGGPYQIEMWSVNAEEALRRDPDRYVRSLPRGKRPGRKQHENEQRREQELAELDAMRDRDPQFGARGAAA